MDYMPYASLTNDELLLDVYNDPAPNAREIELAQRLELLQEELDSHVERIRELEETAG